MTYTAPASKVLTVLHIQDPSVPAAEKPEPSDGQTKCGLSLLVAELWVPVEQRDTDSICRACLGVPDEQPGMW